MRPTVLVTRPGPQAGELVALLRRRGIGAVTVPTVAIQPDGGGELDRMLGSLDGADWLVLTSANGAAALASRIRATGRDVPPATRVAAVGPATSAALRAAGLRVDHVPDRYLTVEIAAGLGELHDRRVVLARADAATPDLREALLDRGARVEEVVAYRTVEAPAASRDELHAALHAGLDGLTFTSSSTVRGLRELVAPIDRARAGSLPAFCIGPVTAATARRNGFHVAAVADEHTAAGLADAVAAHLAEHDR